MDWPWTEGRGEINFFSFSLRQIQRTHIQTSIKKNTCRQNFHSTFPPSFLNLRMEFDFKWHINEAQQCFTLVCQIYDYCISSYLIVYLIAECSISLFKFSPLNIDLQLYVLSKWLCFVFVTVLMIIWLWSHFISVI